MTPISLTIQNFRGFRDAKTFEFPQGPGLFFMQGRNEVEPRLGGNGAGKSTIWEALHWTITGRTTGGLQASDVCNWSAAKGTSVRFVYSVAGIVYAVERTWGPNTWRMTSLDEGWERDLAKEADNLFLRHLGLSTDVFLHSAMMAQNGERFLDLKKDAQAELFSKVLDQDKWLEYSAKASRMASAQDAVCRRLEQEVSRIVGRTEEQRDYAQEVRDWEDRRARELDALEKDHKALLDQRRDIKARHDKAKGGGQSVSRDDLEAAQRTVRKAEGHYRDTVEALGDVKFEIKVLEDKLERLVAELDELESSDECPTCGSSLADAPRHAQHVQAVQKQVDEAEPEVKRLTKLRASLTTEVELILGTVDKAKADLNALRDKREQDEAQARNLGRELARLDQELDKLEDRAERVQSERNPFLAMQKEALERARTAQAELLKARQGLDSAMEKYSLYGLWVRGFKEIRLQQLSEALAELEIEVNSSVAELGLEGWEITFDVDRETKGGKVQRGFAVMVKSPGSKKAVPWASWSGGEKQRLRLAGEMGLSNLARTRLGVLLPLEIWDEPSTGLSPEGVHDLMTCLERRARVEGRQIWVVDHTSHDFGAWSGQVTIVKDAKGSRIEQ